MLKRKGKGWRSTLYGFLGATIATEIILLASNSDGEGSYIPNEAAAIFTGFFLGAPIGAIVGSKRMKYNLLGNEELRFNKVTKVFTEEDVWSGLKMLEIEYETTSLPEKPDEEPFRDYLEMIRNMVI